MTAETRKPPKELKIVHPSYQPSKAELEEDLRIKSTPAKLVKAVVQDVSIRYKRKPKWAL